MPLTELLRRLRSEMAERVSHLGPAPVVLVTSLALVFGAGWIGYALRGARAVADAGTPGIYTGSLPDGATYQIQIPAHFNGILALYSHGYQPPGGFNPAYDTGSIGVGAWLVSHGYAVAGSSYGSTGWAVRSAVVDQMATLDRFDVLEGRRPSEVIAWGHSLGGLVTLALAEEHPDEISGALSLCGISAGAEDFWNVELAAMVAFRALLAPNSGLEVIDISHPGRNLALARRMIAKAQTSALGRARIALVSAIAGIPGWYSPQTAPPGSAEGQELAQYNWWSQSLLPFLADYRHQLTELAGGNFATDAGFDDSRALSRSPDSREVRDLYRAAGIEPSADLRRLGSMPTIRAKASAVDYVERYFSGLAQEGEGYSMGRIYVPTLTLHTTGDGLVPPWNESVLASEAQHEGRSALLRQLWVQRAGHCSFSDAETVAALESIVHRVGTGSWGSTAPAHMNAMARAVRVESSADRLAGSFVGALPGFVGYRAPPQP